MDAVSSDFKAILGYIYTWSTYNYISVGYSAVIYHVVASAGINALTSAMMMLRMIHVIIIIFIILFIV